MTAYFDKLSRHIHEAATEDDLRAIDERVVRDMALATMEPGFPEDLRDQIDTILLQWSPCTNNMLIDAPWTGPSDVEDEAGYRACLQRLQWDLHSVFHERAAAQPEMGDNPCIWIQSLEAQAEERREYLAQKLRGVRTPPETCPDDL